jgi:peptidoglycan/xylan/chitin deacetylase (PgdA/CDA1 family)
MDTHISHAIPQLDSIGLRGTFYINSVNGRTAVIGWKNAAKKGHELGNHTIFHPCPRGMGWAEEVATENYTVKRIIEEIKTVDMMLKQLDSTRSFRTFAYPCNNHSVGGEDYSKALTKKGLIKYARTGGDKYSIITDFNNLNPLKVPSYAVDENTPADSLIAYAERVKASGGLGIFQFHGIGGQWIKVSDETHIRLLQYLKTNEKDYWVAPFGDVMRYVKP